MDTARTTSAVTATPSGTTADAYAGDATPCLNTIPAAHPLTEGAETTVCTDPVDRPERFSLQLGRRVRAASGILGQVDGLLVNYRLGNGLSVDGVAGYAAAGEDQPVNLDKQVFGISANATRIVPAWDLSGFFVETQKSGRTDNRTLGGVLRHLRPKRSVFLSLDYNTTESSLSTLMISGAWKVLTLTTLSATIDLSRHHAHRGSETFLRQTLTSTEGWKWALPIDRIRSLTANDSTEVASAGFGLTHNLSQHFDLNADTAILGLMGPTASDQANGLRSREYYYHLKLTAKDLVSAGDRSALAVRYSVTEASRSSSASLDTRYAINRMCNLSPRIQTDYRTDLKQNSEKWTTSPALKMEYSWRQDRGLEIEAGGKWSNQRLPAETRNDTSYFLTLNYQATF
jgi:hypothetical protein